MSETRSQSRFAGKAALVTGASKGTGEAISKRLAAEGAAVAVTARDASAAQRVVDEIAACGGRAIALRLDVGDESEVIAAVDATVAAFGSLDVLVNNAAAINAVQPGIDRPVAEQTNEGFDAVLRVNLWGVFWMCKHALPHLVVRGGAIVNISSNSAERSVPGLPTYESTKGAMNVITRSIAVDYGARGVRCNTVSLGLIVSHYMEADAEDPEVLRSFGDHTLVGRGGSPGDVAAAVAFLASDEASYITGALLHVDGGSSARSPASTTVLDAMMRPSATRAETPTQASVEA